MSTAPPIPSKNPDPQENTCKSDFFLGCKPPPEPELLANGWEQRFIADERMIKDTVSTYEECGYEVKLVPLSGVSLREECSGCLLSVSQFSVLYTRKKE